MSSTETLDQFKNIQLFCVGQFDRFKLRPQIFLFLERTHAPLWVRNRASIKQGSHWRHLSRQRCVVTIIIKAWMSSTGKKKLIIITYQPEHT